jgi:hypothetical protein
MTEDGAGQDRLEQVAFPALAAADLARAERYGTVRLVTAGEPAREVLETFAEVEVVDSPADVARAEAWELEEVDIDATAMPLAWTGCAPSVTGSVPCLASVRSPTGKSCICGGVGWRRAGDVPDGDRV